MGTALSRSDVDPAPSIEELILYSEFDPTPIAEELLATGGYAVIISVINYNY
jgi:hypothetical protein